MLQNELLGQSLYNFVHSEDYDELKRNLTPDGQPTSPGQTSDLASDSNSSSSSEDATSRKTERPKFFREQRRSFKIRMSQRTVSRREHTQYEHLNISGILRLAEACKNMETNEGRGRHRGDWQEFLFYFYQKKSLISSFAALNILLLSIFCGN